ncbi:hypothetical protein FBY31_0611 [Arthrobacter sp. SLBN-100]|uniref:hypothetical protein n=1 Tax=Arthrobacter sp. SLBN-100 TaxID=2768450 RepID=UPI00114F33EA|nr:hypothetical protein [Arthrobacter sp. SLBN-100]TQJ66575.1 hypothetical protein FBY31_0611 [Arthrobacter sp. SLBN-100]
MSEYFQGDLSEEEKVTQQRIYDVLAETMNAESPVHQNHGDAYQAQFDKGNITEDYLSLNITGGWSQDAIARREAGFSHQVTGIYCPMRAQTLKSLETGKATCWWTGGAVRDGEAVSESEWAEVSEVSYDDPEKLRQMDVRLEKSEGIYKISSMLQVL